MTNINLEQETNTNKRTFFKFNCGNLKSRNDVSFLKDLDHCSKQIFEKKIIQDPILNIEIIMVYEVEIDDSMADDTIYENDLIGKKAYIEIPLLYIEIGTPSLKLKEELFAEKITYKDFLKEFEKKNTLYLCADFWIGQENKIKDKFISKMTSKIQRVELGPRSIGDLETNNGYAWHVDNEVIRNNYDNPSWDEDIWVIDLDDNDFIFLEEIKQNLGKDVVFAFPHLLNKDKENLNKKNIKWEAD